MKKLVLTLLLSSAALFAQADSWSECYAHKLYQIKLAQALEDKRLPRGYTSNEAVRQQVRWLEQWLRSNCRRHAAKLKFVQSYS